MICYFPTAYPDELLYSQLSRYYVKSGYLAYTYASEDLFQQRTVRPNMEFITALTPDAVEMVTKQMSIEAVIQRHTMFPYYGHFLPKERREKAFESLVSMRRDYYNLLPLPKRKSGADRYLQYCPLCAKQDRNIYGETYWHRTHQMIGMNVCPEHGCYLIDSGITTSSKAPPMLKTAEESIPTSEAIRYSDNEQERCVAEYMTAVFQMDVDLVSDVSTARFFHSKMAETRYCSTHGEQRNISLFHVAFIERYIALPNNWFTKAWQLQKVMTDDRTNFYEVCWMAMFLNIPTDELVNRILPEKTKQQLFDEEIYKLHKQGLKYPEIAKRLNASYDVVKSIGERRYGRYHKESKKPLKSGAKPQNWAQIDDATLPLVRDTIRRLLDDEHTRPVKISVPLIERILNLPNERIRNNLPKCKTEVLNHRETQEQYWAREVVWAAKKIKITGGLLSLDENPSTDQYA